MRRLIRFWRRGGTSRPSPETTPLIPWTREEVAARLLDASPTAGPSLAGDLRPAVRLVTAAVEDRGLPVGAGKLGGAPDLPAGLGWPTWVDRSGEERSHTFFAQLDLAEIARAAPAPLNLPVEGLLSFFCDFSFDGLAGIMGLMPWEQPGSRIVHTATDVDLVRRPSPVKALPSASLSPIGIWTWPQHPPAGVILPDSEFDALDGLEQAYRVAILPPGSRSGFHQVGGHARYIQHPVEEEVVQALHVNDDHGNFVRDRWESAKHLVTEWRVVLQIDSDEELDLMWGDVGMLYWAARQEDIDDAKWGEAMFNFQCS